MKHIRMLKMFLIISGISMYLLHFAGLLQMTDSQILKVGAILFSLLSIIYILSLNRERIKNAENNRRFRKMKEDLLAKDKQIKDLSGELARVKSAARKACVEDHINDVLVDDASKKAASSVKKI